MSASLAGRTALVSGASRGIGAAIATALGDAGARVALLARTREPLEKAAERAGNGAFAVQCDVTSVTGIANASARVIQELGGAPDILVNNAGLFTIRAIEDTTLEEFQSIVTTNLTASFAFLNAFLPVMRKRGSGHIVTIGSIADRHIFSGNAAYSAAKFGSRAVVEVLRSETRGSGLRTTLISPAAVNTEIWNPVRYLGTNERADRNAMLSPEAVAAAVLYAVTQPADVNVDELRLSRS